LGVGDHEGRLDLRGLPSPADERVTIAIHEVAGMRFEQKEGQTPRELEGVRLENLDLSGAQFAHIRFIECRIDACRFDGADLAGIGMWLTDVSDSSFVGADLTQAQIGAWSLGSIDPGPPRGNTFHRCDLPNARMRATNCDAGEFVDCSFHGTTIEHVDFGSTSFIRCDFTGKLTEVTFWDEGFETGKPDPNPMEDVDFSDAMLRDVGFHRLSLDRVTLPTGPDYLHFRQYGRVLDGVLAELERDDHRSTRGLRGYLRAVADWLRPDQDVGLLNVHDLGETDEEIEFARNLLLRHQQLVLQQSR
jgi:uncharacterized protein YjbI with pentapeptide repeats